MEWNDENLYNLDMVIDPSVIIRNGGRTICTRSWWQSVNQWCDEVKLYAPLSGTGWTTVGTERMQLRPNSLYVVPPHHPVSFGTPSQLVIDWLHFAPISPVVDAKLAALTAVQKLSPALATRWLPTCRLIPMLVKEPSSALTCRIHALLLEIMGILLADLTTVDARAWSTYERLMPAMRFMEDHVNDPPSLAEMAAHVHLSPEYFHRLFSSLFRTTPFAYLLQRRMAKAHRLLSEGVMPVNRVAAICGFEDPYYFSRAFRRHYGCTPRAVRQGRIHVVP